MIITLLLGTDFFPLAKTSIFSTHTCQMKDKICSLTGPDPLSSFSALRSPCSIGLVVWWHCFVRHHLYKAHKPRWELWAGQRESLCNGHHTTSGKWGFLHLDGDGGCPVFWLYLRSLCVPLKLVSMVNVSECMFYHKHHTSTNEGCALVFHERWCLLTLQGWDGVRTVAWGGCGRPIWGAHCGTTTSEGVRLSQEHHKGN